jgi:hypothetical protein
MTRLSEGPFGNCPESDAADEEGAQGDADQGLEDIKAPFRIAEERMSENHSAEAVLDHSAALHDFEAWLIVDPSSDLHDAAKDGSLVQEFGAIVGAVGEQMLHPQPTLADGIADHLCAGAVGASRRGQIDHQRPVPRGPVPRGKEIVTDPAVRGTGVPLHPGAARYYVEHAMIRSPHRGDPLEPRSTERIGSRARLKRA